MEVYRSRFSVMPGSDYGEIHQAAQEVYKKISKRTKRRPYIRSRYFDKSKVFLDVFWKHLWSKNWHDRTRRLKFYQCALDLIENNKYNSESKNNPNNRKEVVHRFKGITKDKKIFYVQIKESKKDDEKNFISVFPQE